MCETLQSFISYLGRERITCRERGRGYVGINTLKCYLRRIFKDKGNNARYKSKTQTCTEIYNGSLLANICTYMLCMYIGVDKIEI